MKTSTGSGVRPLTAPELLAMIAAAEESLTTELAVLDGLNVFPVPDGDTGKNMLATVRSALAAARAAGPSTMTAAVAAGALTGARGNSGVLLAQLFQGLEQAHGRLPEALASAATLARRAISSPVEGTMLSVLEATAGAGWDTDSPAAALGSMCLAAEAAVARTPSQLPVLMTAQVVDSGGYGLLLLLRAWYQALAGRAAPTTHRPLLGVARIRRQARHGGVSPIQLVGGAVTNYGHCVTLLVDAADASEDAVREHLAALGDSVIVIKANGRLKLHVHVPTIDPVTTYAAQLGRIASSEISNIDEQTAGLPASPLLAVVPGAGFGRVFEQFGVATLPWDGPRPPSAAALCTRGQPLVEHFGQVFILPNNVPLLEALRLVAPQRPSILVVPSTSAAQGIGAALAFNANLPPAENLARMTRAAGQVRTIEILDPAAANRRRRPDPDQQLLTLDGQPVGTGLGSLGLLASHLPDAELATMYAGHSVSTGERNDLRARCAAALPHLTVEMLEGGQTHARFIIAVE